MAYYQLELGQVKVKVWDGGEHGHYLVTEFPDGTKVKAAPNYDQDSFNRAHNLGYGRDTWSMSRDHEILHTWIAQLMDEPWSPTLWCVAHHCKPEKGLFYREECLVFDFQRCVMGVGTIDQDYIRELTEDHETLQRYVLEARSLLGYPPEGPRRA